MMAAWSAAQYLKFEDERTRAARDLLNAVAIETPATIVDVGCGPGNSTELLVARYPDAKVLGIDNSAEMLTAARTRLPAAIFLEADVSAWMPASPPGLIYANAVFQWVPDHLLVMSRLIGALAPGGVLAVQMPDNLDEPSHRLMSEVAESVSFAEAFRPPVTREALPSAGAYYNALRKVAARIEIWRTTYFHVLADAGAIVEWVKGTGLRPYLDRLAQRQREEFLALYRERIAVEYPPQSDGRVLLRFPRLFIVATKAL
jgi:trans-aconitate 2-methyltransferase